MTKAFLGSGNVINLFHFTRPGLKYFKRNRLNSLMLRIIQRAWRETKGAVARYIDYYWPRDTSAMIRSAKKWLSRYKVYDINKIPNLIIGSDVDYAAWVFSMAERMARRGKSVNWTNPQTKKIEDEILGETVDYTKRIFTIKIKHILKEFSLGWLFGQGRPPKKKTRVKIDKNVRTLPRYRGKHKIIASG